MIFLPFELSCKRSLILRRRKQYKNLSLPFNLPFGFGEPTIFNRMQTPIYISPSEKRFLLNSKAANIAVKDPSQFFDSLALKQVARILVARRIAN